MINFDELIDAEVICVPYIHDDAPESARKKHLTHQMVVNIMMSMNQPARSDDFYLFDPDESIEGYTYWQEMGFE